MGAWNDAFYIPLTGCGKTPIAVTPAKAGVQKKLKRLDSWFRRNDDVKRKGLFQHFAKVLQKTQL